jgi:hypothetical protein
MTLGGTTPSGFRPTVTPTRRAASAEYLDETVRVWLGLPGVEASVPQLPPTLARLLLRLEEYERPERDRWGCWDYDRSENFQAGLLREPEIDRWLADQRTELARSTRLEPLWPLGKRFAVCLTHDVDLVSEQFTPRQAFRYAAAGLAPGVAARGEQLVRFARLGVRLGRALKSGIRWAPSLAETIEQSVAVEAHRHAVASYFFTVPPWGSRSRYDCVYAPEDRCRFRGTRMRIVDVMRVLAEEGFDVGLHGGYGSGLQPAALTTERARLQGEGMFAITSTRQHFLHWDVRTTPGLQEEAGLTVDSSLGFNGNIGYRAGTALPFHHFDVINGRRLGLLEVPLVVQDTALLMPAALNLRPVAAREVVERLMDTASSLGSAITLLFHPDKFARPEWLALYEFALDHALARGGWLTSLQALDDWWRRREARLLAG